MREKIDSILEKYLGEGKSSLEGKAKGLNKKIVDLSDKELQLNLQIHAAKERGADVSQLEKSKEAVKKEIDTLGAQRGQLRLQMKAEKDKRKAAGK